MPIKRVYISKEWLEFSFKLLYYVAAKCQFTKQIGVLSKSEEVAICLDSVNCNILSPHLHSIINMS